MPRYLQLRKEARALVAEAKAIQAKAASEEERDLTPEENELIDAKIAEATAKGTEANRLQQLEQTEALLAAEGLNPDAAVTTVAGKAADGTVVRLQDNLSAEESAAARAALAGAGRPAAEAKDPKEEGRCGFGMIGEYFIAVVEACKRGGSMDQRLAALRYTQAATGGSQSVGSSGGFLVPPTFADTIWDGMQQEMMALLPRTDNFTVTGESITFPANAETSRVGGILFGGVEANWLAEAEQIPNTNPTFRQVRLEPQELAVLIFQTDKLLRNNVVALEQFLTRAASETIMFKVNEAIYRGDGAGKPLGLLNSGALIVVAKESGQLADTFNFANAAKMYSRLHAARRANAIWLINQDVEPQLFSIVDPSNNVPMFVPPGRISDAPFGSLFGRPILPFEHCSTLGDLGDIMFVDLRAYATATRAGGGIMSAQSPHLRFDFSETAFRFIFEVDGKSWLADPITPPQSSLTLSPYVTLAART